MTKDLLCDEGPYSQYDLTRKRVIKMLYSEVLPQARISIEDMRCAWVLSTGRCGTSTMDGILSLSEGVASFHEPMPRLYELNDRAYTGRHRETLDAIVKYSKSDLISAVNVLGAVYAECSHRMTYYAKSLKHVFPTSKFIYVKRSMDEVVSSAYLRQWYKPTDQFLVGRIKPETPIEDRRKLLAWYWCATNTFILDFLETLDPKDWFYVDFDAIKHRDYDTFLRMFEWRGVDPPPTGLMEGVFHGEKNYGPRTPVEKNWHEYDALEAVINGTVKSWQCGNAVPGGVRV